MDAANTVVTSLWADITIPQLIMWAGSAGATLLAFWRFVLRKKLETLRQNDETALRYRQVQEEHRTKFQADIMGYVEVMKQENHDLRERLFASEKEKLLLLREVAELQSKVIGLETTVKELTRELNIMRGAPHANHG